MTTQVNIGEAIAKEIDYSATALETVRQKADAIRQVATTLGISATGLAGSIAEENHYFNIDTVKNWYQENVLWGTLGSSNPQLLADYALAVKYGWDKKPENYVLKGEDLLRRAFEPLMQDIGPFNIKVLTAYRLVLEYSHEFTASDPLSLKQQA